jgi:hypothetical protein
MNDVEVFRPKSNLAWAGLSYFLVFVFVIQSALYPGEIENTLVNAAIVIVVTSSVYAIWVRPKIVLHREFVQVVNPFSKINIRYQEIEKLSTHWCLQITHKLVTTAVWVAPANSRKAALGRAGMRIKGISESHDRSISDSEIASQLIEARLKSH